jgi:uncharacterized membrane protein
MNKPPEYPPEQEPEMPSPSPEAAFNETVWSYRGYKLRASDFTTAMVHFFRAEIQRANVWRSRLDTTTNWAVVTTGVAVSVAFAQQGSHIVILMNLVLITLFLTIEARRYRYYELWSYRVRLMETDFFAAMLVPPFHPSADWAEGLADSLLHPDFPISNYEAIGRRLRRNYLALYLIIGAAWFARIWLLPTPVSTWSTALQRASIGPISGETVLIVVLLFYLGLVFFSLATIGLQQSAGEVLPRYGSFSEQAHEGEPDREDVEAESAAWFRPSRRRKQLLTLIITDQSQDVSNKIIQEMKRGVTALAGVGMFTGKPHQVLMCALTVSEIPQLKDLVKSVDTNAFVIVSPAQAIFGRGFMPLSEVNKKVRQ